MEAIHVEGYDDKWLIELIPHNTWDPRGPRVYRVGGVAQTYATEDHANAVIKWLQSRGEQGALDNYQGDRSSPAQEPQVIDPNAVPKRVRRG